MTTGKEKKIDIIEDNDLISQAMNGKPLDMALYAWLGADIMKLSYIKVALLEGKDPKTVADFYGVTLDGLYKFVIKDTK